MKEKLNCADLFAGIGGLSLAFTQADWEMIYANDNDEKCALTFEKNFGDLLVIKDVTRKSETDYQSVTVDLKKLEITVVLAGFPCQSFSQAGKQEGFSDCKGRGQLVWELLDLLAEVRAPVIFFENVARLATHGQGKTLAAILAKLKEIGYYCQWRILSSDEYGNLPQQRGRFYLVGFLDQEKAYRFTWPNKIALTQTAFDLLKPEVDEHYYYKNTALWQEKLQFHNWREDEIYLWRRNQLRVYKNGICPTLLASMGTGGHNVPLIKDKKGVRKLTPRECARLQGFSDDFILPLSLAEKVLYQQLGNTVSVPVVKRIAEQIKLVLL